MRLSRTGIGRWAGPYSLFSLLTARVSAQTPNGSRASTAWDGPWETVLAQPGGAMMPAGVVEMVLIYTLWVIVALILVYTARHYLFTLSRLLGRQRHPYAALDTLVWPHLTVFVPAHNEETVIAGSLDALLEVDYPSDRMRVVVVNDRSTDRTREIVDGYAQRYPDRIVPFHREGGMPGKAAALGDAMALAYGEIALVFDADYLPGRDLIRQLAAPFADPQVGAVMGRVIPDNAGKNLLTRLLDLERTGGYQVDQQARMNLDLIPQYGGTVGGVRLRALDAVGGWRPDALAEDTDLTFRLVADGWTVAYVNRSECYEEVPESWAVRIRQIRRWARGHTDAAQRHALKVLSARALRPRARLDGLLLLGVYAMSPVLLLGWVVATALFYLGYHPVHGLLAALAVASYNTVGNFAVFFEIGTAARLDGAPRRTRLLPLNAFGFLVSLVASSQAVLAGMIPRRRQRVVWDKTERYRGEEPPESPAVDADRDAARSDRAPNPPARVRS